LRKRKEALVVLLKPKPAVGACKNKNAEVITMISSQNFLLAFSKILSEYLKHLFRMIIRFFNADGEIMLAEKRVVLEERRMENLLDWLELKSR